MLEICDEAKAILDAYGTPGNPNDIIVFYVPKTKSPRLLQGFALPRDWGGPSDGWYAEHGGCCYIDILRRNAATLAHEVGYLLNLRHLESIASERSTPGYQQNLMYGGWVVYWRGESSPFENKRLRKSQQAEMDVSGYLEQVSDE